MLHHEKESAAMGVRSLCRTIHETFEDKVNAAMNAAREKAGKTALQSLRYSNNVVQMSLAGSKGSNLNISQMVACCAQQNVEGKRIPFGFTQRTLPHFNKDNYGPESRCALPACIFLCCCAPSYDLL
jgi:DNA-directed RNA polymerase II subunit RPB1